MDGKKQLSVLPIYAFALVWLLWALIFHFSAWWSFLLCLVFSAAVAGGLLFAFPPKEVQPNSNSAVTSQTSQALNEWKALELRALNSARNFNGTIISGPLQVLSESITKICEAIKLDPSRASYDRVRKLKILLNDSDRYLDEYRICSETQNPGSNAMELLELTEEAFTKLSIESRDVADAVFANSVMSLRADNRVLDQMFEKLKSQSASLHTSSRTQQKTTTGKPSIWDV